MDKLCKTCNVTKPIINFVKSTNTKSGYRHICKDCFNAYYRQRRIDKWEVVRGYEKKFHTKRRLKYEYGITESDYNSIAEAQNYKCKICNTETKLVVDHCHKTNKVRGLLCNPCNMALGLLKDNINSLENAKTYLQQTNG